MALCPFPLNTNSKWGGTVAWPSLGTGGAAADAKLLTPTPQPFLRGARADGPEVTGATSQLGGSRAEALHKRWAPAEGPEGLSRVCDTSDPRTGHRP